MRRKTRRVLVAIVAASALPAAALEVQRVDVSRDGARYHVEMQVVLDASAARSYAVFADPAQLTRINPAVREARVLDAPSTADTRLATVVRVCVAGFCRRLRQVQDMRHSRRDDGGAEVQAQVLPPLSDFRFGHATWSFRACGAQQTCLHFRAQMEPAFWVPPLIGPWIIQRKLRSEAIETSAGLERLAREAP